MPERVTKKEKLLELVIAKAKEVLQEANVNTMEIDEPLTGEEVKVKRPKKNPSEVQLPKTSNIEGKENKISKTSKEILKTPYDTKEYQNRLDLDMEREREKLKRELPNMLTPLFDDKLREFQTLNTKAGGRGSLGSYDAFPIPIKLEDAHKLVEAVGGNVEELETEMEKLYNGMNIEIEHTKTTRTNEVVFTFTPKSGGIPFAEVSE
jgi:hypothetical protein